MTYSQQIKQNTANKRFRRRLRSKQKQKEKRIARSHYKALAITQLQGIKSFSDALGRWLPPTLKYILNCSESNLCFDQLSHGLAIKNGNLRVPEKFSIVENPDESFRFIHRVVSCLIFQTHTKVTIDYKHCNQLDLGAQVFLDIILRDIIKFFNRCRKHKVTRPRVTQIEGNAPLNKDARKLLYSVGSPAIHSSASISFSDIIPYKLCIHDRETNGDPKKIREQKDLDTTKLVDYVIACLKTLKHELSPTKLDDLCTVIGEILINAEEHSTTKHRFSIGYFHEKNEDGNHYGVFRLAILNFGKTIYEKFKDPDCPNQKIVARMKALSSEYTKKKLFRQSFEEETLWTLYSLQDGVTSVSREDYIKRGHGSLSFIESFFDIKGSNNTDNFSKLAILSGHTSINFDDDYGMTHETIGTEKHRKMTFNSSGRIEDPPDKTKVKHTKNYFPGTIISARILFNEDDLSKTTND